MNKSFTRGQASETKQEGFRCHLGGVFKLKKASFIPRKNTFIAYPKLGLTLSGLGGWTGRGKKTTLMTS